MLPDNERTYDTRSSLRNTLKTFAEWTSTFHATFFPYRTNEWNQLNDDFKNTESIKKFNDTINPMRSCGAATQTTIHYLFHCRVYSIQRVELLNGVYKLDSTLQNCSEDQLLTNLVLKNLL